MDKKKPNIEHRSETEKGYENFFSKGLNCIFDRTEIVFKEKKSSIILGDNIILSKCHIEMASFSTLEINDNTQFTGKISIGSYCKVSLGKNITVTSNCRLRVVEATELKIGDDCMIAANVSLRTNDGHPIYDAKARDRINPSKSIFIGNHVWLADEVLVLKGVNIGNATIVGARSVVTKKLPSNAICAGVPAKVLRTGVSWERDKNTVTEDYYL